MSRFKRKPSPPSGEGQDAPLSIKVLVFMTLVIGSLGYLVTSEAQLSPLILGLFGGMALLGLFLVGFSKPEVPLYLFTAYIPFSKQLAGDFGGLMTAFNLTNLFFVMLFFGWLTGSATRKKAGFEGNAMHAPIFLITVWGLVSFFVTGARIGSWYYSVQLDEMKRWLDPVVVYFLYFHLVQDRQRWKNIIIIIMISIVVVALMAIWEYFDVAGASSLESSRVYGIADNPNSLGAFFVYYMMLFAAFWFDRPFKRWLLLVPFLLCFRGIMVTFSRGAYLAFGLASLGLAFIRNKFLFLLGVFMVSMVVVNPQLIPNEGIRYRLVDSTFKNKSTQLTDYYGIEGLEKQVDTSAGVRLIIWDGAKKIIAAFPIFGVGLGNFQQVIMRYTVLPKQYDAHNAYLLAGAEQGIPMLAFIIFFLAMVLWTSYFVYRKATDNFIRTTASGVFAGTLGLALANMFGSRINSMEVTGYFFVLAALMARADVWVKAELKRLRMAATAARRAAREAAMRKRGRI